MTQTVSPTDGPVTVLTVGYGTRDDDLPTSLSATVNGTADFLTTYMVAGSTPDFGQSAP